MQLSRLTMQLTIGQLADFTINLPGSPKDQSEGDYKIGDIPCEINEEIMKPMLPTEKYFSKLELVYLFYGAMPTGG